MSNDESTWGPPSPSPPWPARDTPDAQDAPAGTTVPRSRLLPASPPTSEPSPGRRRSRPRARVLVAVGLAVLVLGGGATAVALWSSGDSGPDTPERVAVATGSDAAATPVLDAVDRTVRNAVIGDCVALRDALDDEKPTTASAVACSDPAATFTVVDANGKSGAARPCRSDATLRSTAVDRVLCLQRVLQAGQCVLGNGTSPFLVSAVGCGELPAAPFTQVFEVDAVAQPGVPAVCTPPAVQVSTSGNRGLCLRQVR